MAVDIYQDRLYGINAKRLQGEYTSHGILLELGEDTVKIYLTEKQAIKVCKQLEAAILTPKIERD
jgi:hypothetical protein